MVLQALVSTFGFALTAVLSTRPLASAAPLSYLPFPRAPDEKRLAVLFVTLDARGHFASYPGLWDGLARRGHDVTVAFPVAASGWFDEYRALYENEHLTNLRGLVTGDSVLAHMVEHDENKVGLAHAWDLLATVVPSFSAMAAVQIPALEAHVAQHGPPDVIVHDLVAYAGTALCRKYDVPCVNAYAWLNNRSTFMQYWRPPSTVGVDAFRPSFAERLQLAVGGAANKFVISYILWRVVTNCDALVGNDRFAGSLNAWADDWHWLRGPLGCPRHSVDLIPVPPGLDQAQITGPATFFVGPMRDMERYPPLEPHSEIAEFLDEAEKIDVPVVFMAMGVTARITADHVDQRLKVVEDLTAEDSTRVLWANRGDATNHSCSKTSALITPWVPQEAALRHPALKVFVTHGGSTSMMEMLAAGVPCVCQPYAFEQVNNCLMMQHRGVCVYVPEGRPPRDLSKAARRILSDYESYTSNVRRVWQRVVAAGTGDDAQGARRAVEVVESVALNGHDYLLPEVCRWPLYQQYHLDVALFVSLAVITCRQVVKVVRYLVGGGGRRQWYFRAHVRYSKKLQ